MIYPHTGVGWLSSPLVWTFQVIYLKEVFENPKQTQGMGYPALGGGRGEGVTKEHPLKVNRERRIPTQIPPKHHVFPLPGPNSEVTSSIEHPSPKLPRPVLSPFHSTDQKLTIGSPRP